MWRGETIDPPPAAALEIVPIYLPRRNGLIERLGASLERAFRLPVRVRAAWFDPEAAWDLSRGQYNSRLMLKLLLGAAGDGVVKRIGVTGVDLFTPVLTYVFGEAQLDGRVAVVSYHRFRPEAYGLPADEARVFARLETEAVHELGHTFGLLHCEQPDCAMHASTYVEEIDLKSASFCTGCLRQLRQRRAVEQSA